MLVRRDGLKERPQAEVHRERARDVATDAAVEIREQRHRLALRLRDRRDEERRATGTRADASLRGDRDLDRTGGRRRRPRATLRREIGERSRRTVDDQLTFHTGAEV